MAATIKIKNSSTASAVPTSSDLVQGELAVNVTDKRIFTENASGTVVELGTNPSILTLPDGSASAPTLTNDGDTNTGIFFPAADTVGITTGGTERARVDSSGNLGLGVTPSAWGSPLIGSLQVGNACISRNSGGATMYLTSNGYFDGTNWKYISTQYAAKYTINNSGGVHIWETAASGTAGNNITFTESMRLDASGNLGVGTTSPAQRLHLAQAGQPKIEFEDTTNSSKGRITTGGSTGSMTFDADPDNAKAGTVMTFNVDATERARIDSSGNFIVNSTTAFPFGNVRAIQLTGSSNGSIEIAHSTSNGSGDPYARFYYNGGQIGSITQNGTTAVAYNTSSDYRLKNSIAPMTGALAKVAALKPVTYKWNADDSDGEGFIAHELAEVCPHAVTGEKDAVDAEGNPKYQGIDTSFLVATLTAAIQELKAEFDAYKASHP